MSTVVEIESVLPKLTTEELRLVEHAVQQQYRQRHDGIVHGDSSGVVTEAEQAKEARRQLHAADGLGLQNKEVFKELCAVAQKCGTRNWDGYGAEPVSADAYKQARRMNDTILPPAVSDDELRARFITTGIWVRQDKSIRPDAFAPPNDLNLSVTRRRALAGLGNDQLRRHVPGPGH